MQGVVFVRARGAALWELAATLAVVGVLAALAAPSFQTSGRGAALRTASDQLFLALHRARSQSILQNVPAIVCASRDGANCLSGASRDAQGWVAYLQRNPSSPPRRRAGDVLLGRGELPRGVELRASRSALTYWPIARAGATGTFLFCDRDRVGAPRAIVVSQSGRPRQTADLRGLSLDCRS